MDPLILATVHLLTFQSPGGQHVSVNIDEISSIREAHDFEEGHFGKDVNCVVVMTNGKAIGTIEICRDIIRRIYEMSPRDLVPK